ncbi:hypothetical protein BV509_15400 [Rhodovulum sulfidophilum]|uniref:Esterase-like activity of phytase family protein n=1 Tax=Rhodovulum visakhapatnamense TaxID=364297 RepID=A0ABS1RJR2_9RHOB|nr:esterase-like activity of phytase family protein [Rhodovulum visakhapatnamense]MBL3568538.1 esterase-like activity of phytase family protein [Rhodovulum visakhapatnamense]MBL3579878.1 esterase-like activity of phytase family protein [Rhodovulum visakhapatnamense]OLS45591.1 hypothetical protein BV509_15400 [Rhodovulum sulfidophilum]
MKNSLFLLSAAVVALAGPALAEETFPAVLSGHAVLPAMTMVAPPADAPRDAWISGKFTGTARNMVPMSAMGDTGKLHGNRATGIALPFIGQPLQGFSGFAMDRAEDGSVYALTDNGFGSKANSPDAMLFFHRIAPDFATGKVDVKETVFLRDPDFKVPFRIAYEGTEGRYLTGADFDLESLQLVDGSLWIGEEFGPYLLNVSLDGVVLGVYPTMADGKELKGADNPAVSATSVPGTDWKSQRSGGYEGMALQPGTSKLWAMLEKPILGEDGTPEGDFLRVMAFDTASKDWTGEMFKFALADGATAIGDFNFIDDTHALVIERDNGEGDPSLKCDGAPAADCFPEPALHKWIVLIDASDVDADGFVRRIGHIDLMDIADPDGVARLDTDAARDLTGKYTFPFFTIEDVMRVDDTHILVANDNNLPFSSGRKLDAAADNEVMLLSVPELLSAK